MALSIPQLWQLGCKRLTSRPSTNVNGDGVVMVHDGDVFVSTNTGRGEWDCGGLSIASSLSVVKW
jgi:hypothetical protein